MCVCKNGGGAVKRTNNYSFCVCNVYVYKSIKSLITTLNLKYSSKYNSRNSKKFSLV